MRDKQVAKFSRIFRSSCHNDTSTNDYSKKPLDKSTWVLNLSKHHLTIAEQKTLERGFNFVDCPTKVPKDDIIASVETALRRCKDEQKGEQARATISNLLRTAKTPKRNTSAEEREALRNLRKNEDITIIPADKGNATVILDTEEYEEKANEILGKPPFKRVSRNPTRRNENRVNDGLKRLLEKQKIDKNTFNSLRVSANGTQLPRFYGTIKIHKPERPLRPIVSAVGSSTYGLSKYVSKLIRPYARDTPSFILNVQHFRELISDIVVADDELLVSFDVKSLFTSVPVDDAMLAIREVLEADDDFEAREEVSVDTVMEMIKICLVTTSFQFRGKYYEQTDGLAMGSPLSPAIANIFMAKLEKTVLEQTDYDERPSAWFRFVDDVFSVIKESAVTSFLQRLNNQHPQIQFTIEKEKEHKLPFLEVTVHRLADGRLATDTYRKPTHTGRFLNYESNHPVHVKAAVATSLFDRVKNITVSDEAKRNEYTRVESELSANGYPTSLLKRAKRKAQQRSEKPQPKKVDKDQESKTDTVVIPYVSGTSEAIRRVLAPLGIRTAFRGTSRKWTLMSGAKDKIPPDTQPGVVYAIGCLDCEQVYVGETARTSRERLKEHKCHTRMGKGELSAVAQHVADTAHEIHWKARILARERTTTARKVREALIIHRLDRKGGQKRTMNQDKGTELSHLWLNAPGT